MSTDGMLEGAYPDDTRHHSNTTETEEEDAVIDQGDGYKLSIMRKKRPLIVADDCDNPTKDNSMNRISKDNSGGLE